MATTTKPKETKKAVASPTQFVTVEQFNDVVGILSKLSDKIDAIGTKTATPVEAAQVKEVEKAKNDKIYVNPTWEEKAREILGERVDYCYQSTDGNLFTVVIKEEFSNAPKEYLQMYKLDKRSKPIGNEGVSGVETFCKLILQNLKRQK
jgi:hypothetical protein